jgi:mycothione reductase
MKEYEAIIIGGGGGLKLRPIANLGHKIAIIEKDALGGTCLNRGCIPSKMLIHAADVMAEQREYEKFFIELKGEMTADFSALTTRTTREVGDVSGKIESAYATNENIDFYDGTARFISNKVVEVNGEQLTAQRIFVATGSRPRIPNIPGLAGTPYMTSTEALRREKKPKSLIVIGGGYIAMELGHFYREMGVEVTWLVRSDVLRGVDCEVVEEFLQEFNQDGSVRLGASTDAVAYENDEFAVTTTDSEGNTTTLKAEALLLATGVQSNSDTLNLENTDVVVNEKGFIEVNDHLETAVPGVYALGDVIGRYLFRHSVNFEGEYLMRVLYEEPCEEGILYPPMPFAVFSRPQIAGVGQTQEELDLMGVDYVVGLNKYENSAMGGDALRLKNGFVKLLFERSSKKLLGAHIVGPEASDMIHMLVLAMTMEASLDDLLKMIYIHPALPEVVRNAARKARDAFSE